MTEFFEYKYKLSVFKIKKEYAMKRIFSVLLSCIISWQALATSQDITAVESINTDSTLSQLVKQLPTTKLNKMAPLVEKIAQTRDKKARERSRSYDGRRSLLP